MLPFSHFGPDQRGFEYSAHRHSRRKARLLRDIAHARALPHRDIARIRVFISGKHLQQRALPRAVWPDQADAVAIGNSKRDLTKQSRSAKGLSQTLRI